MITEKKGKTDDFLMSENEENIAQLKPIVRELEEVLNEENLIFEEGEQKFYQVSLTEDVEELMERPLGKIKGEFQQVKHWHQPKSQEDEVNQQLAKSLEKILTRLQGIEDKLHQLEFVILSVYPTIPNINSSKPE